MKKNIIFIFMLIAVLTFSGCKKDDEEHIGSTKVNSDTTVFNQETSNKSSEKTENVDKEPKEKKQDAFKATNSGQDLIYSNLSNKVIGWGLGRNNEHKTPSIPTEWRNMLNKYNGLFVGDESQKVVYLTFDEGYENGYTSKILDILKENNVQSTFFVTGPYVQKNSELVERMINEGHIVGNHTIGHPSLPSKSSEQIENEIIDLDRMVYDKWKYNMRFMRPPMGEISEKVLAQLKDLGHTAVMWSFAYKDYDVNAQPSNGYAHEIIMDNLHPGAIYLLHAVSKTNTEVLDSVIKDIRAQGYEIRNLDTITK